MIVCGSVVNVINDVTSREACPDLLYTPRPLTPPPCQNSATKWDAQEREAQNIIASMGVNPPPKKYLKKIALSIVKNICMYT